MNANETAEFNIRTAIAYERADNGRDKNEKLTPIKSEFTTTYHINIASVHSGRCFIRMPTEQKRKIWHTMQQTEQQL